MRQPQQWRSNYSLLQAATAMNSNPGWEHTRASQATQLLSSLGPTRCAAARSTTNCPLRLALLQAREGGWQQAVQLLDQRLQGAGSGSVAIGWCDSTTNSSSSQSLPSRACCMPAAAACSQLHPIGEAVPAAHSRSPHLHRQQALPGPAMAAQPLDGRVPRKLRHNLQQQSAHSRSVS